MLEFEWIWVFFLLPLPLLILLLPSKKQGQEAALRVPSLTKGIEVKSQRKGTKKLTLILATFAWIALVLATARPQWLGEPVSIPTEGRDLMIAVDLSGSMKIDDMQVNGRQVDRLKMIKFVLSDFIKRRVGDRLGLILFAVGTGPIKGFSITLMIGIITSMFTAIIVTRVIVNAWWGGKRLTKLSI